MNPHITEALVARVVDHGESDRILTLLTRGLGKISAVARGARRSRKRFGGALGLFVLGEASVRPRRGGELMFLERFDAREDLAAPISADVVKVAHGSYMLELARELWPAEQREPALFDAVADGLRVLAAQAPSPLLLRAFELRLLTIAGFVPALDHCAGCGQTVSSGAFGFSVTKGGLICPACGPHGWPVAPALLELLRALAARPLHQAPSLAADGETRRSARELMMMVVRHHVGKDLQSLRFIAQLAGL